MVNLIILLVSIGLLAIAAVAALYFGGDAYSEGSLKVEYSTIQNGHNQVVTAAHIYMARNNGALPTTEDLDGRTIAEFFVDENYLDEVPRGVDEYLGTNKPYQFLNGYSIHPIKTDEERAIQMNRIAGAPDDNIPSCDDPFDYRYPVCKN